MNKTNSIAERNKLFVDHVQPAFEKLVSYWYVNLPKNVPKNPELKQDALTDLFEKIPKFDGEKHSRGFPYFNMIARNFFIQYMKKQAREISYGEIFTPLDEVQNTDNEPWYDDIEEKIEKKQFVEVFKEELEKWHDSAKKEQEKKLISALVMLFDNTENMDMFDRKATYVYLREITGFNSKQITANLKKIKSKFYNLKRNWQNGDI